MDKDDAKPACLSEEAFSSILESFESDGETVLNLSIYELEEACSTTGNYLSYNTAVVEAVLQCWTSFLSGGQCYRK